VCVCVWIACLLLADSVFHGTFLQRVSWCSITAETHCELCSSQTIRQQTITLAYLLSNGLCRMGTTVLPKVEHLRTWLIPRNVLVNSTSRYRFLANRTRVVQSQLTKVFEHQGTSL
jgi:hypothetical protein